MVEFFSPVPKTGLYTHPILQKGTHQEALHSRQQHTSVPRSASRLLYRIGVIWLLYSGLISPVSRDEPDDTFSLKATKR